MADAHGGEAADTRRGSRLARDAASTPTPSAIAEQARRRSRQRFPGRPRPKPPAKPRPALPAERWATTPTAPAGQRRGLRSRSLRRRGEDRSPTISPTSSASPSPTRRSRLIGQALINEIDEAGYLRADARRDRRAPRRAAGDRRGDACRRPDLRAGRRRRARPRRMPGDPASRARPLRPGDGRRSIAHLDLVAKRDHAALRRLCGVDEEDLADMLAETPRAQPEARQRLRRDARAAGDPRRASCAPAPDGGWLVELNAGTLPRVLVNQTYYAQRRQAAEERHRQGLSRRLPADRELAGEEPRPAGAHDPQGRDRDRAPAGRLPRRGRPAPPPAQPEDRRRGDQHARIDRVARHLEQIHGDAARHLRAEIFLHRRRSPPPTAARRIRPKPCASASAS